MADAAMVNGVTLFGGKAVVGISVGNVSLCSLYAAG